MYFFKIIKVHGEMVESIFINFWRNLQVFRVQFLSNWKISFFNISLKNLEVIVRTHSNTYISF